MILPTGKKYEVFGDYTHGMRYEAEEGKTHVSICMPRLFYSQV